MFLRNKLRNRPFGVIIPPKIVRSQKKSKITPIFFTAKLNTFFLNKTLNNMKIICPRYYTVFNFTVVKLQETDCIP